jgi:ABC-type sulfate/molybdate transport systems ATPase subunit
MAHARALGAGAGVLLLDEPFGALEIGDMVYVRTRRERTFSA